MKVSVLIPYYNDREFLPQAIESVLNQTFEDFELILVNHATTDDCREIAHSYTDPRIVHIDMDKNYGAGTGLIMEAFLNKTQGEYIKLFCADDVMKPDCLKILVEYMETHPDKDFAFGNMEYINEKNKDLKKDWFSNRTHFSLRNDEIECLKLFFKGYGFLPYPASIVKRKVLYDIDIDYCFVPTFDITVWIQLLINGCKIGYIDKCVNKYRIHKAQISSLFNKNKINQYSMFEAPQNKLLYTKTDNLDMFKKIFSDNYFVKTIDNLEKKDMEFIVYYEMLIHESSNVQIVGYHKLYKLLQDTQTRQYLENKFGFGIKELRKICSTYVPFGKGYIKFENILYYLIKIIARLLTLYKIRKLKNKKATL